MKRDPLPPVLALVAALALALGGAALASGRAVASAAPAPAATVVVLGAGAHAEADRGTLTRLVSSRAAAGPVALLRATPPASLLVPPTRSLAALRSGLDGAAADATDPAGAAVALRALTARLAQSPEVVLAGLSPEEVRTLRAALGRDAEGLTLTLLQDARTTTTTAPERVASAPPVITVDRAVASTGPSPVLVLLVLVGGFGLVVVTVRRTRLQAHGALAGRVGVWTDAGRSFGVPAAPAPTEPQPTEFAAGSLLARIQEQLDLTDMRLSARDLVLRTALGTLAGTVVLALVSPLLMPVAWVAGPLVARKIVRRAVRKRRAAFAAQLGDTVQAIASAMRAGHGISSAMAMLVDDMPSPAADELRAVVAAERIGVGFEEAMREAIARTANRDFEQVAMVATLQRESGGNGAEALDRVVETIRARDDVRRLMKTLTAQGVMSRWVLTALPVGVALAMLVVGHGYLAPLWQTPLGIVVSVLSIFWLSVGSFWIGRIVEIEV